MSGLEPWLQLALFLLHTRKQRGEWHAYLASLPEPQTPLSWPDADVELLHGTQLHSTLSSYRCGPILHIDCLRSAEEAALMCSFSRGRSVRGHA